MGPLGRPIHLDVQAAEVSAELSRYVETETNPKDQRAIARAFDALPLWADMGGIILLKPSGEIVGVDWESPGVVAAVVHASHDYLLLHAALVTGARRYPAIS